MRSKSLRNTTVPLSFSQHQVSELERKCATKDAEFDAYRTQLLNKPETTLQAQVNMLRLEKVRKYCLDFTVSLPYLTYLP